MSTPSLVSSSRNIVQLLHHRQYGLTNRQSFLSSLFHTPHLPVHFAPRRKSTWINRADHHQKKPTSRKRTVSENDENRREHGNENTSKRLCRSSEWIFGDSQLTLFKSISTIDNRPSLIHDQSNNYLLSKSDEYLANHTNRRYSSDKQQTIDTLSTLVLSQ